MEQVVAIRQHRIRFYIDSERAEQSGDLTQRMALMRDALSLLPDSHLAAIAEPIIVVDRFPGGRTSAGGWFPPTQVSAWTSARGSRNTGVSSDDIAARTGGGTGIIGLTTVAFMKDDDYGFGHRACEYTLLHEVAHCIDFHLGLMPPARMDRRYGNQPYQGQRYGSPRVREFAAEAYSRFFLRPNSMCRGGSGTPPCIGPNHRPAPSGSRCPTQAACSGRLQRDLAASPAFAGSGVVFPLAQSARVRDEDGERFAQQPPAAPPLGVEPHGAAPPPSGVLGPAWAPAGPITEEPDESTSSGAARPSPTPPPVEEVECSGAEPHGLPA